MGGVLVIENDPTDDIRRLGIWLTAAGLALEVTRPHIGQPLRASLDDYDALIVMGGGQDAFGDPGDGGAPWFEALRELLRSAVDRRMPVLGICLGAQLLAQTFGGHVGRSPEGQDIGVRELLLHEVATTDPLFAGMAPTVPVVSWHRDEITLLPPESVLLAGWVLQPNQAFRVHDCAWGLQFHIEPDVAMIRSWVGTNLELIEDRVELIRATDAAMGALAATWQPFARRFAVLAQARAASP